MSEYWHLVLKQPWKPMIKILQNDTYIYPYILPFKLCILNGSGLWMNVGEWVEKGKEKDSEVGSAASSLTISLAALK